MTSQLTVSATSLEKFLTCPYQYVMYRQLRPRVVSKALQDGLDAHAILSGEDTATTPSTDATTYASFLANLEAFNGYDILEREYTNYVRVKTGAVLHRRVDFLALSKFSVPCVGDYKTSKYQWAVVERTVPRSSGIQAIAYTWPAVLPKRGVGHRLRGEWPSKCDFLVCTLSGWADTFAYQRNESDMNEFVEVVDMVRDATRLGRFPRHKGYMCQNCDFAAACFERAGWQEKYDERRPTNEEISDDVANSR
jgi:hypothetical protein